MRKILALFVLVAALASCQYKELEELEDTLYRGYDVYENVLKGEPFWEEDK